MSFGNLHYTQIISRTHVLRDVPSFDLCETGYYEAMRTDGLVIAVHYCALLGRLSAGFLTRII